MKLIICLMLTLTFLSSCAHKKDCGCCGKDQMKTSATDAKQDKECKSCGDKK